MPRPIKKKRVCQLPEITAFGPLNHPKKCKRITMLVDEYETIRLIDYMGLTQEEAASRMNVARTSVQRTYVSARYKLSVSLITGAKLYIEGGHFDICNRKQKHCKSCKDKT